MTQIAIAPRPGTIRSGFSSNKKAGSEIGLQERIGMDRKPLIGQRMIDANAQVRHEDAPSFPTKAPFAKKEEASFAPEEKSLLQPLTEITEEAKQMQADLQKTVRKMPTLYVIAFFGVVVGCAVLIIWNTLQVNTLTLKRTSLQTRIAQTEQRLIKLRAHEMQLSAPTRIRDLARTKLGMVEETGENLIAIPTQD